MGKIVLPAGKFNRLCMSQRVGTMPFVSLAFPHPVKYTFEKMLKDATLQTELTFKKISSKGERAPSRSWKGYSMN